jgi:hypothetical protein
LKKSENEALDFLRTLLKTSIERAVPKEEELFRTVMNDSMNEAFTNTNVLEALQTDEFDVLAFRDKGLPILMERILYWQGQHPELNDIKYGNMFMMFVRAFQARLFQVSNLKASTKVELGMELKTYLQDELFVIKEKEVDEVLQPHLEHLEKQIERNKIVAKNEKSKQPIAIVLPSDAQKQKPVICFICKLNHSQRKILHGWLTDHQCTTAPVSFIDFLLGDNKKIAVNPDKLHLIAYLLFRLYNYKIQPQWLSLNHGGSYFKHFEEYAYPYPFSKKGEKRYMKDFKREVVDSRYKKEDVIKAVDALIGQLLKAQAV